MYQIDFDRPIRVHFIGIGGISMSGLAEVLLRRGFAVTGSDREESELTRKLADEGAEIFLGQRAENITDGIGAVVYTAAIHPDNPEFVRAKEKKIPMLSRAELLGQLMRNYETAVAVAGTHGKTTTTSMTAEILLAADADPTVSLGGMLDDIGGNFRIGQSGCFVTEACEYTNSFLSFYPTVGVILNIAADHLDFFKDLADIRHSFRLFAGRIPEDGLLILSSAIPDFEEITRGLSCRVQTFGERPEDDYRAEDLTFDEDGRARFAVRARGERPERLSLGVPGAYNVSNALAAAAVCRSLGVSWDAVREGLAHFTGTHRRFERKGTLPGDVVVIDDYAHHPDEIRAALQTAEKFGRRVVCVFQPHTYSRTKALMDGFAEALSLADEVVLAKIYPARETDDLGISSRDLAEKIAAKGKPVRTFDTFGQIEEYLKKNLQNRELLITMGAGDIVKVGEDLLSR